MTYLKLDDEDFHKTIPNSPGVYKIYSLNEKGKPHILSRLLGNDEEGVLYIGQSEKLNDRLRLLFRVLHPEKYKATAHTFGDKYRINNSLKMKFPVKSLAISFEKVDDAKTCEEKLIRKYSEKFGEVPPCNSNSPKENNA